MKAIGSDGEWWWNLPSLRRKNESRRRGSRNQDARGRRRGSPREPLSSSSDSVGQSHGWPLDFPFRQAVTAACLTLTGDTIAQVHRRIVDRRSRGPEPDSKAIVPDLLLNHDWLRGLRIASYGFLLYGPGSYAWYQFLDRCMPKPTLATLSAKVWYAPSGGARATPRPRQPQATFDYCSYNQRSNQPSWGLSPPLSY